MTLQSCFHTSIFFSNGVMASFTLFSSMLAMSLLHSRKAMFSYCAISYGDISLFHSGLLGIFNGLYFGCLILSSVKNLLIIPAAFSRLSNLFTSGINVLVSTTYYPYLSASNFLFDISAICINSSKEFYSRIDLSWGLCYGAESVVWTLNPSLSIFLALFTPVLFISDLPRLELVLKFLVGISVALKYNTNI